MKLPKHRMDKQPKVVRKQRTLKHKVRSETSLAVVQEEMEIDNEGNEDENSAMDVYLTEKPFSKAPINLKSKEERKVIRDTRKKANRTKNFYKIRKGNVTGKNGPRAINTTSLM